MFLVSQNTSVPWQTQFQIDWKHGFSLLTSVSKTQKSWYFVLFVLILYADFTFPKVCRKGCEKLCLSRKHTQNQQNTRTIITILALNNTLSTLTQTHAINLTHTIDEHDHIHTTQRNPSTQNTTRTRNTQRMQKRVQPTRQASTHAYTQTSN